MDSNFVLFWKWIGFAIWEKRYDLCKTLAFEWIGLWNVEVYNNPLIYYFCICLVGTFKHICFVLPDNLENGKMIRTCLDIVIS